MTCRHGPNDPMCSSYVPPKTPDAENYEVLDAEMIENYLLLRVVYPNCKQCSFEGVKVMVFEGESFQDALRWKKIDPHFRSPEGGRPLREAPPPVARFPGSDSGWADARSFAHWKSKA